MKRLAVLSLAALAVPLSFAQVLAPITGKVVDIVADEYSASFELDEPSHCGTAYYFVDEVDFGSTSFLSILQTSLSSGTDVTVTVSECQAGVAKVTGLVAG
jgi:hypothetical protein